MSTEVGGQFLHFDLIDTLGEGAWGFVRLGRHRLTGELSAFKFLHLARRQDASSVRRFIAEGRSALAIDHLNVVKVFDMNCEPDGLVWLRLEYLRGEDLARFLARQGFCSAIFALSAAIEAAHGLAAAHELGIIHRDVKPANLFYSQGRIKVIDLSVAKVFGGELATTLGRGALGTPAYMAPELLKGELASPQSDVYALGLTLYELFTGVAPFSDVAHDRTELIRKQLRVMPPPLTGIHGLPSAVDAVVARMIAKNPAERMGSMTEAAQELSAVRSWLLAEQAAGRMRLETPGNEPAPPGDPTMRRDYTPPVTLPGRREAPPAMPPARVIVPLAGEAAPVPKPPARTLAQTQDDPSCDGTIAIPSRVAPPAPSPTHRPARRPEWKPLPTLPMSAVPEPSLRPPSASASPRDRPRAFWLLVTLVSLLTSAVAVSLARWMEWL